MDNYKRLKTTGSLFTELLPNSIVHKHFREGCKASMLLLGVSTNGDANYKQYMCITCGYICDLQPTHIRRNSVRCTICLDADYSARGNNSGFTFVSLTDDSDYRLYRRGACGHILKLRVQAVGKRIKRNSGEDSGQSCIVCYEEKLVADAEKIDMTYLGAALHNKGVFRHYLFNSCGHKRDVNAACVGRGAVVCQDCVVDKYKSEASAVGLIYNGAATDRPDIKRNYIMECGHNKDIRMDHVRHGSWTCTDCGDTHYTKPSKVYLLKITSPEFSWLKLGYAKDIDIRSSSYGLPKGSVVDTLFSMDVITGLAALHIEKKLHSEFKRFRINAKTMKKYHKYNGFTECYNTDIQEDLVQALNNILKENNG